VILKSYLIEQNPRLLDKYKAVILYGENEGIKDDIKTELKIINKDAEIISFFENEILKDKDIVYKNIINESLFNENKIIFIQSVSDKIYEEVVECLKKNNKAIKIYIFADNLDKKSKLRNLFEKEKELAIFACYIDNERTLISYINKELYGFKGLTGEIINLIILNSSLNRRIIKSEIKKIKDFSNNKTINKKQILEILNIKHDTGFDEIRDHALAGKKDKVNKLLSEIEIFNEDSFYYLSNLNYRILKLIDIQKANEIFKNHQEAIESIRPPIFWKDKPVYLEQLKNWNLEKLNKAFYKIGETEVLMKKNSQIRNDIIIKDLIIHLFE